MRTGRRNVQWTPLAIIGGALALVDAALSISSAFASGALQWFMASSAIVLAFGIVGSFFYTLWRKPETLYPPEAYDTPEHMKAYGALLGRSGTAPVPLDLAEQLQEAIDTVLAQKRGEGPIGPGQQEYPEAIGVTGAELYEELTPRQFLRVEFSEEVSDRRPLVLLYDSSVRLSGILTEVYWYLHPETHWGRKSRIGEEFIEVLSFFERLNLEKADGTIVYSPYRTDPEITLEQAGIRVGDTIFLRPA